MKANRAFQFIGGAFQAYVGLGWLGVIDGFANTKSIVSIIFGFLFLLSGITSVILVFKKDGQQGFDGKTWPKPSSEVLAWASAGNKNAAIKAYRKQTGAGLKDAKNMVEKYSVS